MSRTIMTQDASRLLEQPSGPKPEFNPKPSDLCYCGSGDPFAMCCGSTQAVRPPPFGLFMFEDYLDKSFVRELVDYANAREGERLMMIDNEKSTPDNIVKIADKRRVAERIELGEYRQPVNELVKSIYVELADQCFGKQLDWYELPDLMCYREGGHYMRHADAENKDMQTQTWTKVIDRDISMLLYLNDEFTGGELSFYKLNYQVWPRAGAAVLFPSDHRFLHQAETVKSGVRYAIVSWASVKGIDKIASTPPESAIAINHAVPDTAPVSPSHV